MKYFEDSMHYGQVKCECSKLEIFNQEVEFQCLCDGMITFRAQIPHGFVDFSAISDLEWIDGFTVEDVINQKRCMYFDMSIYQVTFRDDEELAFSITFKN